ncbi:TIM barrel protein [Haloferula sp. BvORR071]|uniref:sugar phosphate isomerase/epimerase family protein n=1 Tax=Haloferula sp. BvORR071 TaxID=1396141 RepID=UPI000697393C|nr:TIM barrel protein [Haloferula sp. BvORR071]
MHRRQFIERSALTLAASSISLSSASAAEEAAGTSRPRLVFTKGLEKVPFDELAEKVAAMGATGLEAPIRKGGHIEPEQAPDKLPEFVAALKKQKLELTILTSDITKADKATETLLRAAIAQGVKRYRLGPYFYDLKKAIAPQVEEVRAKLKDLAAMNKELGIQGQFQNHRGNNRVGSPLWDLIEALGGIDPAQLGIAFDFAHATVEGQNAWELNLRRALPHVVAVYFKDYKLEGREWMPCPLGEGCVTDKSAALVKQILPADIPASLHVEYIEGKDTVPRTLEAMKKDLATVKGWLG